MKKDCPSKSKFKALKRRFNLTHWQTIGLLESLWHATQHNAPAGDIGKLSNDEIAAELEWSGDANELVEALVEFRWLDVDDEFRLIVHDWSDHVPASLSNAFKGHKKLFADVVAKQRAKQPAKQPAKQVSSNLLSNPLSTLHPNLTIPNRTVPIDAGASEPPIAAQSAPRGNFKQPTVEEVEAYCDERDNAVDAQAFVDHYESNGWKVGRVAMKDWKASVRTWERNSPKPESRVCTAEEGLRYNPLTGIE